MTPEEYRALAEQCATASSEIVRFNLGELALLLREASAAIQELSRVESSDEPSADSMALPALLDAALTLPKAQEIGRAALVAEGCDDCEHSGIVWIDDEATGGWPATCGACIYCPDHFPSPAQFRSEVAALRAQLADATAVTDEMVERAAEVLAGEWEGPERPPGSYDRSIARRMLDAARPVLAVLVEPTKENDHAN